LVFPFPPLPISGGGVEGNKKNKKKFKIQRGAASWVTPDIRVGRGGGGGVAVE